MNFLRGPSSGLLALKLLPYVSMLHCQHFSHFTYMCPAYFLRPGLPKDRSQVFPVSPDLHKGRTGPFPQARLSAGWVIIIYPLYMQQAAWNLCDHTLVESQEEERL